MKKYEIQIFSFVDMGNVQFMNDLLFFLKNEQNGMFFPDRFGAGEPLQKQFCPGNMDEFYKTRPWPPFLGRKENPKNRITIANKFSQTDLMGSDSKDNLYLWHMIIRLASTTPQKKVEDFFRSLIIFSKAEYSFCTSFRQSLLRQYAIFKSDEPKCISSEYTPMYYDNLWWKMLNGIFFKTYISNRQIEKRFDPQKFTLLGEQAKKFSDGIIISAYDKCFDDDTEKEREIEKILGENNFFNLERYYKENNLTPLPINLSRYF